MKHGAKKCAAVLLALVMTLSVMSGLVMAEGDILTGSCGGSVTWTLQDGLLTLSGEGNTSN